MRQGGTRKLLKGKSGPPSWRWRWLGVLSFLALVALAAGPQDLGERVRSWLRPTARSGAPPTLADEEAFGVADMTLEQKVGQMIMAGFPGKEPGPEVRTLIEQHHVGGVILFSSGERNNMVDPAQTARLTAQLQQMALKANGVPLFIATDQEGGMVTRLPGAAPYPGNMALGAAGSVQLAEAVAYAMGEELRAVGVNMNFAPAVDVNVNPRNPVIGIRSFGEEPEQVAALGAAMIRGLQAAGVSATAKHFPGHGDTAVDSHVALPTISHTAEQLARIDLEPFKSAIAAGVDAIMTGHLTVPAVDTDPGVPATLSTKVLTGLLREKLGFTGLIVTDAMEMGAITGHFGFEEAVVRAVLAGADVVLVAWPKDWRDGAKAATALLKAVRDGRISESRIDASVSRILQVKQRRGLTNGAHADPAGAVATVGNPRAQALAQQVARQSVTLVRDTAGLIPLGPSAGKILVVSPTDEAITPVEQRTPQRSSLHTALAAHFPNVEGFTVSLKPSAGERTEARRRAAAADTVVVVTLKAWSGAYEAQAQLVSDILALGKPLIVVSVREPYDLERFPGVKTYLATYGGSPLSLQAVADVIAGKIQPVGRLPVGIPGLYRVGAGIVRN